MASQRKVIPIYTTRGDVGAYLAYPYIFSAIGEWIGWVTPEREVYSVYGGYVGSLGSGPRILRKRSDSYGKIEQPNPSTSREYYAPRACPAAPYDAGTAYGDHRCSRRSPGLDAQY
jgi:hypothetical protein